METLGKAEVRVGPLTNVERVLRSLGCDPAPVFSHAGFTIEEFRDTEHRVDFHAGDALLAECVRVSHCEHFGLLLGQWALPVDLGLVSEISSCAPSVSVALTDIVTYLDLHDTGGIAALEYSSELCTLSYALHVEGLQATEIIYDLAASMLCNIMRGLCGLNSSPSAIYLARSKPGDLSPYRKYLRGPLHFDATNTAISFHRKLLQRAPDNANEARHSALQADAKTKLATKEPQLAQKARDLIRRGLLAGNSDVTDVATALKLHERTLNRRLNAEGTSYRELLESVRFAVGQHYLAGTDLPVSDIAHALGYGSIAAFDHAFKRWASVSPKSWRQQFAAQQSTAG